MSEAGPQERRTTRRRPSRRRSGARRTDRRPRTLSPAEVERRSALVPRVSYPEELPVSGRRDGHRGRHPRPPGGDRGRGDRLGQDHPDPEDLPGARPRRARPDRAHPAPPDRGPQRRRADRGGDRHAAGGDRGLPGAVHRPLLARHPREADDRRHPARRAAARPAALGLRHADHRRGPRAQPEHRLHPRLPAPAAAAAAGPQDDHHLRDHRPRAVRGALRGARRDARADRRGVRAHLPRRGPLPPAGRGVLRRRGGRAARPRPDRGDRRRGPGAGPRGARRHPGVPARRAGDPRHRRRADQARHPTGRLLRRGAAVRPAVLGRAAQGLRAARPPPGGAVDQRRRDVADRARHPVRRRRRPGPDLAVLRAHQGAAAADRADQPGVGQPALGPLRPGRGGHRDPALQRGGLRVAPGVHRAGDPAHQPRLGDPADDRARARRRRPVPVRRPAGLPQRQGRHPAARGARRARRLADRGPPAHPAGAPARRAAGGPAAGPDGGRGRAAGLPARGAGDHRGAVPAGPARASRRAAGPGRPEARPLQGRDARTS